MDKYEKVLKKLMEYEKGCMPSKFEGDCVSEGCGHEHSEKISNKKSLTVKDSFQDANSKYHFSKDKKTKKGKK